MFVRIIICKIVLIMWLFRNIFLNDGCWKILSLISKDNKIKVLQTNKTSNDQIGNYDCPTLVLVMKWQWTSDRNQ